MRTYPDIPRERRSWTTPKVAGMIQAIAPRASYTDAQVGKLIARAWTVWRFVTTRIVSVVGRFMFAYVGDFGDCSRRHQLRDRDARSLIVSAAPCRGAQQRCLTDWWICIDASAQLSDSEFPEHCPRHSFATGVDGADDDSGKTARFSSTKIQFRQNDTRLLSVRAGYRYTTVRENQNRTLDAVELIDFSKIGATRIVADKPNTKNDLSKELAELCQRSAEGSLQYIEDNKFGNLT